MRKVKSIAIYLKPNPTSDFNTTVPNLVSWLTKRKINIYFPKKFETIASKLLSSKVKFVKFIEEKELHLKADLILSLGGDGTLLGVCRQVRKNSPPIFGVNMGKLGFITEFTKAELFDELECVISGKYDIQKLSLYKVEVKNKQGKVQYKSLFVNDVVLNQSSISRLVTLSVELKGDHIYDLSGDGLIVCTPIGSTAYSLAAGGPIVHPGINGIILTPICPHSLTYRPLVIPHNESVLIKNLNKDTNLSLTVDGQEIYDIQKGDCISISRSKSISAQLVHNPIRTYFQSLKEKFTHGKRV